jgi:hypothetical protein
MFEHIDGHGDLRSGQKTLADLERFEKWENRQVFAAVVKQKELRLARELLGRELAGTILSRTTLGQASAWGWFRNGGKILSRVHVMRQAWRILSRATTSDSLIRRIAEPLCVEDVGSSWKET